MSSSRFAQLTYTSFDTGTGGGGGWRVKDTRGGLTADEEQFLTSQVATQFDTDSPIPQFPTPEEVLTLPRRLVHAPTPRGASAYWHTAPSGAAGSGRPGNVFAHVLLDRAPRSADQPLRPTDLWDSPHWLRPFGPQEVPAASLDAVPDPPWADPELSKGRVLDFVCTAAVERFGVLATLLDAVASALRDGPRVVLGTTSPASAALWIASVCHLMSPGTSRTLYWSGRERATSLDGVWKKGVQVAAVPCADVALLGDAGLVVIDETAPPALGFLGGDPHRSPVGLPVRVTPWSAISQVVLEDRGLAERVLTLQDEVAAEVGDHDLAPGWPMAMAVAHMPDTIADAQDEAIQLLGAAMPAHLRDSPKLDGVVRTLLTRRFLGTTTADALAQVDVARDGVLAAPRDLAVSVYLTRALQDHRWLMRPGGVPVPVLGPGPRVPDPDLRARAHEALRAAEQRATDLDPDRDAVPVAAWALRLLDLVLRAGLLDMADLSQQQTTEVAYRLMRRLVAPVVLDPVRGPRLALAVGVLDELTQAEFVRPSVADGLRESGAAPGQRVPPAVLAWIYHAAAPVPPSVEALAAGERPDPVLVELAVQLTGVTPDPSAFRPMALWNALREQAAGAPMLPVLARLASGPAFPAADLRAAMAAFDPLQLVPFLLPTLRTHPSGKDLDALVDAIIGVEDAFAAQSATDAGVSTMLKANSLRYYTATWWRKRTDERTSGNAQRLLALTEELLAADPTAVLAPDLASSIAAARTVDVVSRPRTEAARPQVDRFLGAAFAGPQPPGAEVVRIIDVATGHGIVTDDDIVLAALYGAPEIAGGPLGTPRLRGLGAATVVVEEGTGPVLDHVVRRRIALGRLPDVPAVWERVRRRIAQDVQDAVQHVKEAERHVAEYERFAQRWWATVGFAGDLGGSSVVSRLLRG